MLPTLRIKAVHQFAQNRNDAHEHGLSFADSFRGAGLLRHQNIKTGSAFGCGSSGIIEKLGTHEGGAPAIAFSGVQNHGKAGAVELVAYFAGGGARDLAALAQQIGHPGDEAKFELIHIELFVVELGDGRHEALRLAFWGDEEELGMVISAVVEDEYEKEDEDDQASVEKEEDYFSFDNSSTSLFTTILESTPSLSAVNVVITRCRSTLSTMATTSSCLTM